MADTGTALSSRQVYEAAKGSVAYITAEMTQQSEEPFGQSQSGQASGSGFVVSKDGYVVTNAHVVDGASAVTVKIGVGDTKTARVVGQDTSSDIALLKFDPGSENRCRSRSPTRMTSTWATPASRSAAPTASSAPSPPAW